MENLEAFQNLIEEVFGKEYDQDIEEVEQIIEDFSKKSCALSDGFLQKINPIVQDVKQICIENKYVFESINIQSIDCIDVVIMSNAFDFEGDIYKTLCRVISQCNEFDIYKTDLFNQDERSDLYIKFTIKDDTV